MREKNTDVHREALEACVAHTNMKYVSYKSGTQSFFEVSILINLGIVTFFISENRDTFEVSVHRATIPGLRTMVSLFLIGQQTRLTLTLWSLRVFLGPGEVLSCPDICAFFSFL